ncbi:MAG: hypothetical protein IT168_10200 [Bryobacterales bacterium]|nr:hypothetical protein [Bryobacterales bacterium]
MSANLLTRPFLVAVLAAIAYFTLGSADARAQAIEGFALRAENFTRVAPHGFGDRNNSWAQSMIWWKGNLYVGTTRQSLCGSMYGFYLLLVSTFGKSLADTFLPYPPLDPDLSCAPDPADLSLQAEIWRWSPTTNLWQRVFQSPATIDNPGHGPPAPPRLGKKLPYEIAFRGFAAHKEPSGTEALYAFGVNSTILWDRNKLPPPRILRSTDGVTWTPLLQTPGTFLEDLPFNDDHSSFRSPASFNGKLFVLSGPVFGQGTLIASANPALGNNAWFQASATGQLFYEIQPYNGWLYIGGFDPQNGYAVFKTRAEGPAPYALTTVIPPGAFLTVRPAKSVVSMHVFNNRLYVGTATQTEIIRINPDDTWDLVVGSPRFDGLASRWKYPISNLDAGFGHTLNDHAWQMSDPYNYMYTGTYNATTGSRNDPVFGPLLQHNMGAHLYRTPDDWYYSAVTTNGFATPSDPFGGKFDYGIRTMASTSYGLFVGTANDYYGTQIFRANKGPSPAVDWPVRLEIEQTKTGSALLSWNAGHKAVSYRIFRAEILPIAIRDEVSYGGIGAPIGSKVPDTYVGPYSQIGTTTDLVFNDLTVLTGRRYMYYVVGQGSTGALSDPSNLMTFPLLLPPVTFAQLVQEVDLWKQRQRFRTPDTQGNTVRQIVATAKTQAAACQFAAAVTTLNPRTTSRYLLLPEVIDAEVLLSKMVRRLQLYARFPTLIQTNEFCASAP